MKSELISGAPTMTIMPEGIETLSPLAKVVFDRMLQEGKVIKPQTAENIAVGVEKHLEVKP